MKLIHMISHQRSFLFNLFYDYTNHNMKSAYNDAGNFHIYNNLLYTKYLYI